MDTSIVTNSQNLSRLGRSDPTLRTYICPASLSAKVLATALRTNTTLN